MNRPQWCPKLNTRHTTVLSRLLCCFVAQIGSQFVIGSHNLSASRINEMHASANDAGHRHVAVVVARIVSGKALDVQAGVRTTVRKTCHSTSNARIQRVGIAIDQSGAVWLAVCFSACTLRFRSTTALKSVGMISCPQKLIQHSFQIAAKCRLMAQGIIGRRSYG